MNENHGAAKGIAALVTGAATLPWGTIAFVVAIIYNIHLIAGWWWDRALRDLWYDLRRRSLHEKAQQRLDFDSESGG